ncbi:hypothetical protein [Streptomyces sp. NPDC002851]
MFPPSTPAPSPNATVIKTGRGSALKAVPCAVIAIAIGIVGIFGAVVVATGNQKGESSVSGYAGVLFMIVIGVFGVCVLIPVWSDRKTRVLVDQTGLWLQKGQLQNVIPWHTLAGVGLYWSNFGKGTKIYSLELCPSGPIDRDDPTLWALVRDEDPIHPHLPRLRYRLPLTAANQRSVVAAVYQYVPNLWLGESQRPEGHIGRPDVKGHKQRTRSR